MICYFPQTHLCRKSLNRVLNFDYLGGVPSQQKKRLIAFILWLNGQQSWINHIWWTCRDLNSGPLPCQGSDLPTDLHAQMGAFANRPHERPS